MQATITTDAHYHIWKYADNGYQPSALFRLTTRYYKRNRANRALHRHHDGDGAVLMCEYGEDCRTQIFDWKR